MMVEGKDSKGRTSTIELPDGSSIPENFTPKSRSKHLKEIPEFTFGEFCSYILALASISSSIAAVIMVGGSYLKAAVIFTFLLAPYCAFQHSRIIDTKALKESFEAISKEVVHLTNENNRLQTAVERMNQTVDELEALENTLDKIQNSESKTIEDLIKSVETNKATLKQMETNVRASVLQNIISVLMTSDTDRDFSLSNKELNKLLESFRGLDGVTVNETKFRKIVKDTNGSLKGVIAILSNLLSDSTSEKDPIFIFKRDS